MLEEKLEQDLKAALLGGEKRKATTLRGLKAAILNAKIASGKREAGLSDGEIQAIYSKQSKQRQESADMYKQGGDQSRAEAELEEKAIIDEYLPQQMSEAEIGSIIDEVIKETGANGPQAMGQVIGQVKQKTGAAAEGSLIARLVKEKLQ
jgi:uncharacterized protein YqeY